MFYYGLWTSDCAARVRIAFMLRSLLLAALVALFLVVGCRTSEPKVGGVIPERLYARVASLSPNTTELLALLNAERVLVGRTASCDSPVTIRAVPIVANPKPDIEKMLERQVELVIADKNLLSDESAEKIKAAGIEVLRLEFNSIQDWIDNVVLLGDMFLKQKVASEKVDAVLRSQSLAKSQPLSPVPKVLVAMGGNQPWAAGVESFQADIVRAAGGEPVGPPGVNYSRVGPEQVLQWNPDVIFVSDDPNAYTLASWKGTNAGKRGLIIEVNPNLLLRAGARVADLIGGLHTELRKIVYHEDSKVESKS